MRDLNECKAEIFRRSENRIKERKKHRNRVLSLCIPLCLVVGALLMLPGLSLAQKNAEQENTKLENTESIVCTYTKVEILNAGQGLIPEMTVTDKVGVTKIFCAVGNCFPSDNSGQKGPTDSKDDASPTETSITIVFTDDAGNQETYNLNGIFLVNLDKNEAVVLTEEQREQLVTVLGVTGANK